MRKLLLATLALLTVSFAYASEPITAKSAIEQVTVYRQGAQITREGKISLVTGRNEIVFSGLETNIDHNTIQASAPIDVLILSVSHEVNYLREKVENPRVKRLTDSLELFGDRMAAEKMKRVALDKELEMILANQNIKGNEKGITAEDLEKAADFYRRRLNDIYDRQLANTQKQREMQEDITKINQQLQELNYRKNQPSNDIVLVVESQRPKTADLGLRYFVQDAGWAPIYDLRAQNTAGPITLKYRAEVYQNTGQNWDQVKLTLNTGNPNRGANRPVLGLWYLGIYQPNMYGQSSYSTGGAPAAAYKTEETKNKPSEEYERTSADGGEEYNFDNNTSLAYFTQVQQNATSAEFKIQVPQDIESGQKPQQVSVQQTELPATYSHFAVPKLDKDAFLLARVTDWEGLNLVPGKVNIFFEGTYVAQSNLNLDGTQDTLDFSLGRDPKIIIDRVQLKDYNRTKTIGATRERTFGYEITIRNTKNEVVNLNLQENIPLSKDKDITINLVEKSEAVENDAQGKIIWKMTLQPLETKKVKLVFEVKYPKNKTVTGW